MVKKCLNKEFSCEIFNGYFETFNHAKNTRNNFYSIKLRGAKLEIVRHGFYFAEGALYNNLPLDIRMTDNVQSFNCNIYMHLS